MENNPIRDAIFGEGNDLDALPNTIGRITSESISEMNRNFPDNEYRFFTCIQVIRMGED